MYLLHCRRALPAAKAAAVELQVSEMSEHYGAKKAAMRMLNSLPVKNIMPFVLFMIILYFIVTVMGSGGGESDTTILDVAIVNENKPQVVQAFVYIAMGGMAKESLAEYSIATLRNVGGWRGKIFVLTDNPSCFTQAIKAFDVIPQKVPSAMDKNVMAIKSLKARIYEFLPIEITSVIYLDVDIMVQRPVAHFLMDIGHSLSKMNDGKDFDIGAFPDAQGHYLGFCSGCEKWHTGVLFTRRHNGSGCLKEWSRIIMSGKFDTDQESLDEAEASGACKNTLTMPPSYLLFAKDYIAMALTSGHTFLHVTAAGRPDAQGYFYKTFVLPSLRGSYVNGVDLSVISKNDECLARL